MKAHSSFGENADGQEVKQILQYKSQGCHDQGRPWKKWNEHVKCSRLDCQYI
jgi:hypothetical protein